MIWFLEALPIHFEIPQSAHTCGHADTPHARSIKVLLYSAPSSTCDVIHLSFNSSIGRMKRGRRYSTTIYWPVWKPTSAWVRSASQPSSRSPRWALDMEPIGNDEMVIW